MKFTFSKYAQGFALPMTILAVAGLSLLLVGLLTVMSLERKTARSYSDAARADLAVESGLSVALGALLEIAGRDDSLVFRVEDPVAPKMTAPENPTGFRQQFFDFGAIFENGSWRAIPLFSGANELVAGSNAIVLNNQSEIQKSLSGFLNGTPAPIPLITPGVLEHAVPRAQWVDLPVDPNSSTTSHFAWWVEDLEGRLDGKVAGSQARELGQTIAEVPLFSFFGENKEGVADGLVQKRQEYRTNASTREALKPNESALFEQGVYYGFPQIGAIAATSVIPQGLGYREAGQPTKDINQFVTDSDLEGLTEHISNNLPDFDATRRGGLPNIDNYVETIAASIIDYADVDSNPTSGTASRGIDSYPFVNQICDRYLVLPPPSSNRGLIRVQVRTFVELWNPSNRTISGTVRLENINFVGVTAGGPRIMAPRMLRTDPVLTPVVLAPNEHRVLELFNDGTKGVPVVHEWTSGIPTAPPYVAIESLKNNYKLFWNNLLVDQARVSAGVERSKGGPSIRDDINNAYGSGNCPEIEPLAGVAGDPRAMWYLTSRIRTLNYEANTNWGGRNLLTNINKPMLISPDPSFPGLQGWSDSGSNFPFGRNPGSRANIPGVRGIVNVSTGALVNSYPPNQPNMAPTRISNLGRYQSLAELGNIYDPAQWTNVNNPSSPANSGAGGGISLAIGRPEYQKFDVEGRRAAQLLDLFHVKNSGNLAFRKININTASRDTLRALMADVILDADPTIANLSPPKNTQIGDLFADAVIHSRNQSVLRAPSDLNQLRVPGTNRFFFGNPEIYPSAKPSESWNDAGREDLFRRVLDLVGFRSKTFRIIVAGQTRDRSGRPVSTSRREFHYALEPVRTADGLIDFTQPPVIRALYRAEP